jgi:hypothetical protein
MKRTLTTRSAGLYFVTSNVATSVDEFDDNDTFLFSSNIFFPDEISKNWIVAEISWFLRVEFTPHTSTVVIVSPYA